MIFLTALQLVVYFLFLCYSLCGGLLTCFAVFYGNAAFVAGVEISIIAIKWNSVHFVWSTTGMFHTTRTLNTGPHWDLSGQRIAVCSAFIFVVYSSTNWNYRKLCSSHMKARCPFTSEYQMFPWSSVGTCHVVVVPESPSLACSIWWNNRNHFDGVFKEFQAYTGMFVFENNVFTFW